jgi:parallel beta-helix repeat protein
VQRVKSIGHHGDGFLNNSLRGRFLYNHALDNGGFGITNAFSGQGGHTICFNRCLRNQTDGIIIFGSKNTIHCNVASDTGLVVDYNFAKGIIVQGDDNRISYNTCTGNRYGGIVLEAGTRNRVHNNRCSKNAIVGIQVIAFGDTFGNTFTKNFAVQNGVNDLNDVYLPNCFNLWTENWFQTDNEGDGPTAGCIQ